MKIYGQINDQNNKTRIWTKTNLKKKKHEKKKDENVMKMKI